MRQALVVLVFVTAVVCAVSAHAQVPDDEKDNKFVGVVSGGFEEDFEAVGALVHEGEIMCTGTLIKEDVVLTAAHCFGDGIKPHEVSFFIGDNLNKRADGEFFKAANAQIHPKYDAKNVKNDIALLILRKKTGVLPIPYRQRKMGKGFVGKKLLYVGYGATSALGNGAGLRRSVRIPTSTVNKKSFEFEDLFDKNTCFGDSGGPAIDTEDDEPTVVGVTSNGDFLCALFNESTRVDAFDGWIRKSIKTGRKAGISKDAPLPAQEEDEYSDDEFADDECCGCATAPGTPTGLLGVALVFIGLVVRRRW